MNLIIFFDKLDHMKYFISDLDTDAFKAFVLAADLENFTEAAQVASMTQSGVSQHVARLEEQLNTSLFSRVGRRVVLTESGKNLKKYILNYWENIEKLKQDFNDQQNRVVGSVHFGMPGSLLLENIYHQVMKKKRRRWPDLSLHVLLGPPAEITQKLLDLELHFALITHDIQASLHPSLETQLMHHEEYILFAKNQQWTKNLNVDRIEEIPMITYPGFEENFSAWYRKWTRCKQVPRRESLNVQGEVNALHAVIDMVNAGLGATVFPKHTVHKELQRGKLIEAKKTGFVAPTKPVHLVKIKNHELPKRAQVVYDFIASYK